MMFERAGAQGSRSQRRVITTANEQGLDEGVIATNRRAVISDADIVVVGMCMRRGVKLCGMVERRRNERQHAIACLCCTSRSGI